jgi:hypothetical protein
VGRGVGVIGAILLATGVDYYQVSCSDDGSGPPASLVLQVLDAAPAAEPLVGVQAQKGFLATNATDATDADSAASPAVSLNGGAGAYDVFVDKSGAGAERYRLTVQCRTGANGGGVDAGTTLTPIAAGPSVPVLTSRGLLTLAASLLAIGSTALRRGGRRARESAGSRRRP